MSDLDLALAPKSDQLNADDLIGTMKTIKISGVEVRTTGQQKITLHYIGENGRPYKPSTGMGRIIRFIFGEDTNTWINEGLILYRDDEVKFGPDKVGGIRIKNMSRIDKPVTIPVTISRGVRKGYTVYPMPDGWDKEFSSKAPDSKPAPAPSPEVSGLSQEEYDNLLASVQNAIDLAALGVTGQTIAANASKLTADEKAELQAAYGKRGKELRGEV